MDPVWGQLAKSAIDPEKIEEAIARLIQDHNDDPEAHLGAGQSLQSHKASEIIDHLARSIITDKINYFYWATVFESLEGFYHEPEKTASITLYPDNVEMATGVESGSRIFLVQEVTYPYLTTFSWDKRREFRTKVFFSSNTNQEIWIITGLKNTNKHIGFKVVNGTLYGTVADGTTESTVDLDSAVSPSGTKNLRCVLSAGEKVEFYVDGVKKGELTTNLPSGTGYASTLMHFDLTNTAAEYKAILFSVWELYQDL